MRYASAKTHQAVLTVALALVCAAVLAVVLPVSALADEPIAGDTTTTSTTTTPTETAIDPGLSPGSDPIAVPGSTDMIVMPPAGSTKSFIAHAKAVRWLSRKAGLYRRAIWKWQNVMGVPRAVLRLRSLQSLSIPALRRKVAGLKTRAAKAHSRASHPPHLAAFLCIHHYEGSWKDDGGPYYGGLQMNLGFQQAYAPHLLRAKGTAEHWTPLEQIWTAEKAAKSRGFYPWPNTARYCGLL